MRWREEEGYFGEKRKRIYKGERGEEEGEGDNSMKREIF